MQVPTFDAVKTRIAQTKYLANQDTNKTTV